MLGRGDEIPGARLLPRALGENISSSKMVPSKSALISIII